MAIFRHYIAEKNYFHQFIIYIDCEFWTNQVCMIFSLGDLYTPVTQISCTTPHYYQKYEI